MILFMLMLAVRIERRQVDYAVFVFPIIAGVLTFLALGDRVRFHEMTSLMHAGTLLIGTYAPIAVFFHLSQLTRLERGIFLTTGTITLMIGVRRVGTSAALKTLAEAAGSHADPATRRRAAAEVRVLTKGREVAKDAARSEKG